MKKKVWLIILIIIIMISCTGCNLKTGTMTCTMTSYPTTGIKLRSIYKAEYKNHYVKKLTSIDEVVVEDKEYLNMYKERLTELYQEYKGLKHYKNTIKIKGNKLTSKTSINYAKIDTKKLIEIDAGNSKLIKNKKVNITDLEDAYKQNGFNCKKEGIR